MFNFGAGRARLIPAGGGQGYELGVIQSASVELKVDLKELRGAYRYPLAIADGKGTCSGKVSFMQLWPATLAAILQGTIGTETYSIEAQTASTATGVPQAQINETGTLTASPGPTYQPLYNGAVTGYSSNGIVLGSEIVTLIYNGTPYFYSATTGSPTSVQISGPSNGTYQWETSGSGGGQIMLFANADGGRTVSMTYLYLPGTSTQNIAVKIAQVGMNTAPTFQMTLIGTGKNIYTNAAQQFITQLNCCIAPSLKLDFKLDDFTGIDLDYSAFIDVNGNLGSFYLINAN